jgi:predicted peptidase
MGRIVWLLISALVTLTSCAKTLFIPSATAGFHLSEGPAPRYWVYVPKDWSADRSWPVIVYLHGMAERGTDGLKPTQHGLGPVVWKSEGKFPAVVIFPQAAPGKFWGMPDTNAQVLAALDEVMARYHGDPSRVYLTGNSMGGFGTWFLGALHPDRFAALVPICGGVRGKAPQKDAPFAAVREDDRPAEIARRVGKLPIWIFHGAKDWLVPVRYSREMEKTLKEQGANVRYTEYPDLGHESWDRAYAEQELWAWLFNQHR